MKAKSTKHMETPDSRKPLTNKSEKEEFELNSETTDRNNLSMTYGARSEISAKKSAMTVIRESQIKKNKEKEKLILYLLTERKQLQDTVKQQKKDLDVFKEEVRRVKTLSHYYPDNNELILEESDKNSSSYESSDDEDKVMIASAQDIKVDSYKSKDSLRNSNPLRQTVDPLRASHNPLAQSLDPLRQAADPLRTSMPMNGACDPLRGTNFSAPNFDPLRSTNYSSPPLTTKAESVYTTKANDCEKIIEYKKLSDAFIKHLTSKNNEEDAKFAEFTFNKIEALFLNFNNEVIQLRDKNNNLMSIITDLKLKSTDQDCKITKEEGERLIQEHEEGKLEDSEITAFHCDWETVERHSEVQVIDSKNNKIKIPDNLMKFGILNKPAKKLKNLDEKDKKESPKDRNWESKSTKSNREKEHNDKKLSINSQDLFEFQNGTFTYCIENKQKTKKRILNIRKITRQRNFRLQSTIIPKFKTQQI